MPKNHEQELEDYIRDGMARALWVHAYMIWTTEVDPAPMLSPGTWDENTPDTASSRRASGQAADDLAEMFRTANRLGDRPMAAIFTASAEGRAFARSHETESTEGDYAYSFGMTLARICLGTVEPEDSVLPLRPRLVVPSFNVDLDDAGQDLTWEGRVDNEPRAWERNPVRNHAEEVLLIEDDPALQRSTSRMIKKIFPGAEIIVADNADAAIANLQHHKFAHVVSDVDILGTKSGIDVFRWVERNQPHMIEHYTFFTGNTDVQQVHDRYVMKPAGLVELRGAVLRVSTPRTGSPHLTHTDSMAETARQPKAAAITGRQVAQAVLAVIPRIKEGTGTQGRSMGRYGARKVFIAAIWRELQRDQTLPGITEREFKKYLMEANRARYLDLARADLVGAMDRQEVAQSEIEDLGATFHFVLDPSVKDPW